MRDRLLLRRALLAAPAIVLGSIVTAETAVALPAAAKDVAPEAPGSVRFLPKARTDSSFSVNVRFEIETKDVTFDVPQAYKDSFAFWGKRMKGSKRSELFQFVNLTDQAAADGTVHFRNSLARYQVELQQDGEVVAPYSTTVKAMEGLAWEGRVDRFGNVQESRLVAGKKDPDMADLGVDWAAAFFPRVEGPLDLRPGDHVMSVQSLPLPSRLNIEGLEEIRVRVTRELTLKSTAGGQASFDIKTTYATDPATKPTVAGASCVLGGGGTGEAVFELKRGIFLSSRQNSTLTIDIQAPLRPLPEHPETQNGGSGKSHLELVIGCNGEQVVHKILGAEED